MFGCAFYYCSLGRMLLVVVELGWKLWVWATYLSTAATIGETVIAAIDAVAASMRNLVGRARLSTTGIVAVRSTELTLIVRFPA